MGAKMNYFSYILCLLLLPVASLGYSQSIDWLNPLQISSPDGLTTWSIYADMEETDRYYALPESIEMNSQSDEPAHIVSWREPDGSIRLSFSWIPVARHAEVLSMEESMEAELDRDIRLVPLTPDFVDSLLFDLELSFAAEILRGQSISPLPGVLHTVEARIPPEFSEAFLDRMTLERCRASGNCGLLLVVSYRFLLRAADGSFQPVQHALSAFVKERPLCDLMKYEPMCFRPFPF